ncbi:MAG: hypothetical protein DHS20C12_25300 [Pseudohongiella sp.]|nr:MAG: hypothetical protein DHS20C12_25300 [Pseudohongiella sp.]
MFRLVKFLLAIMGFFLISPAAHPQEVELSEQEAQDRRARIEELRQLSQAEREARRVERQRQIDSLTDEQRAALKERQRIRQARGAGQRGQRPPRRRPPANSSQGAADGEDSDSS